MKNYYSLDFYKSNDMNNESIINKQELLRAVRSADSRGLSKILYEKDDRFDILLKDQDMHTEIIKVLWRQYNKC